MACGGTKQVEGNRSTMESQSVFPFCFTAPINIIKLVFLSQRMICGKVWEEPDRTICINDNFQ
jgi:hypothetical protein